MRNVIDIALIKADAHSLGITEVTQNDKGIMFVFEAKRIDMKAISGIIAKSKGKALFSAGERPYLMIRENDRYHKKETLSNIKFLLQSMKELQSA